MFFFFFRTPTQLGPQRGAILGPGGQQFLENSLGYQGGGPKFFYARKKAFNQEFPKKIWGGGELLLKIQKKKNFAGVEKWEAPKGAEGPSGKKPVSLGFLFYFFFL